MSTPSSSRVAWIASYPKSGNTWVRILLTALETDREPDINRIPGGLGGDNEELNIRGSFSDLTEREALKYRRSVAATLRQGDSFVRLKTHDAWLPAADGVPRNWQPEGARAIYLVRDPRAVAVSWAHHMGVVHERAIEIMSNEEFVVGQMHLPNEKSLLSSWSTNVRSWTTQGDIPVLILRFEDILADPVTAAVKMGDWLHIPHNPDSLTRAVAASSHDVLAAAEIINGFRETASVERAFFRRGEADSWRFELAEVLQERVVRDHGDVMKTMGYF
jgi:aryl sulfotransferase